MSRVHTIILEDYEERYAPPKRVLKLQVVDNVVFLNVCEYAETYETQGLMNEGETFMADINVLRAALDLLEASDR